MTKVSLKRQPTLPARIELGRDLNGKFNLNLPEDALAFVTADVSTITSAATFYPFMNSDLIADVQQAVVADRNCALLLAFDLYGAHVAKYFEQGSAKNSFLLVLVDEPSHSARVLNIGLVMEMHEQKTQAVAYFSALRTNPAQAERYVAAVARAGYLSVATSADVARTSYLPSQVHFRPVFSQEHAPFIDGSLDALVSAGSRLGSLGKMMNARFVGAGTLEEVTALAESLGQPKH